jgi:DNA gyrase subunit A
MEEISERLIPTNITEIMQTAYIDYSMSVIVSRALPDVRDGFKPVQRRVLYAMMREGLLHNRPYDKCAGVVGEVLKNYHPHGDGSVYDTLVRMAQPWVMRYPLVDGQGNFGSVDGDSAAAYRYTECRLTRIAEEMLRDIDEDTVDFAPNYKESSTEPTVLPAALPNLLMNGSTGIAVGMTTNIPPHNLGEIIDATCALINDPSITIDELMQHLPGPDFPSGGTISGSESIQSYMKTGRGIVRMRGSMEVEELPSGRQQIVITQIPYNTNRATLVTRIADLVKDKLLDGVSDLRDESTETTRIVVELKMGEIERVTLNKLYKMTALESSFGVILLAIDKRRPRQMNIKEMLECYVEHRREVIFRRTQFRLRKAEDRAHILEGYKIALDNLDEFVRIIRASANRNEAKAKLMEKFTISERQTNAILDLRLYQLTGMEREKIEEEYAGLMVLIEGFREIIGNESRLLEVIKDDLLEMKDAYPSPRRCIITEAEGDIRMEDLIPNDGCVITITKNGFIKRTSVDEYRSQHRGGKGVIGSGQREEDPIDQLFTANAHDTMMFFMNNGRVYVEKVYEVPEGRRDSKGRSIVNLLQMQKNEKVAAMVCVEDFEQPVSLVLCTRKVIEARKTTGDDHILMLTHNGKGLRFHENQLRNQGRVTRGVRGIRLREGDHVESMLVVDDERLLLIAGTNGLGIRTEFSAFLPRGGEGEGNTPRKRGGYGVIAMDAKALAGALAVDEDDEIMMLTKKGQAIRCPVLHIRETNRGTKGVKLVDLAKGDKLIAISRVVAMQEGDDENPEDSPIDTEPNQELLEESVPDENSPSPELAAEDVAESRPPHAEESSDGDET